MTDESPDAADMRRQPWRLVPATSDDAAGLTALDRALARDGRGMVISEAQVRSDAAEAERLATLTEAAPSGSLCLLAKVDADTVGAAELRVLSPRRCAHVGLLSLGVHPDWQGKGLGRALMVELIGHARAHSLRRLELCVRADNLRAIALYESLGFVTEGVRRGFIALDDGGFADDLLMARWLPERDREDCPLADLGDRVTRS